MNKNLKGFTLLETVVSIALFSISVLVILGTFAKIIQIQYEIYDTQALQNNARYLIEVLSKEARMARIDSAGSCISSGKTFYANTEAGGISIFQFLNYRGECIKYEFKPEYKKIYKSINGGQNVSIVSSEVEIESAMFASADDISGGIQPKAAFRVLLNNPNYEEETKKLKIQTVISARVYP